jgi:peptidoglycan L-alanyl-D-glutamate endopeptidase CwlK
MVNNMFNFSQSSLNKLSTVNPSLQLLAKEVIKISPIDFAITSGIRTKEEQIKLFKEGKSKCDGINNISKHQTGDAMDICPCLNGKLDYTAENDLYFIIGLFYAEAKEMGLKIRVGALWDGESIKGNRWVDGWHVETM